MMTTSPWKILWDGVAEDGVAADGVAADGVVEDGVVEDGAVEHGVIGMTKTTSPRKILLSGVAEDGVAENGFVPQNGVNTEYGLLGNRIFCEELWRPTLDFVKHFGNRYC